MQRAAQNTPEGLRRAQRVRAENRTPHQGWRSCYGVLLGAQPGPNQEQKPHAQPRCCRSEANTAASATRPGTLSSVGQEGPQRQAPKWPTVVTAYNSSPTCLPPGHAASTSLGQEGDRGGGNPNGEPLGKPGASGALLSADTEAAPCSALPPKRVSRQGTGRDGEHCSA